MNKTAIKNFAVWARRKLISEITYKAGLIGISEKGILHPLSTSTDNIQFFDIGTGKPTEIVDAEIKQREALIKRIKEKEATTDHKTAFQFVIEEVAYTWFNRLIAIRFMEVNDYLPSGIRVLSSETDGKAEPDIVTTPFDTDMEFSAYEKDRILQLKDENKLDELFRMLFIKQCNKLNEVLSELFKQTDDYTELLLTISFTDSDGIVSHLIHDIEEVDFKEAVEIIGWLYQYYNEERKNEVINIYKGTVKKDDIPAATQVFTTDWVVRYMVDNSLGRYWIERNPHSRLQDKLKYFVTPKDGEIQYVDEKVSPEELSFFDPCMGSGHILVYAFDVLMEIYRESGYVDRDAAQVIIENNIFGLDIDNRAYQLAYFAVMMKARSYDRRFLTREIQPNVSAIIETNNLEAFTCEGVTNNAEQNSIGEYLINVYKDAKEIGSLLTIENYDYASFEEYLTSINLTGQLTMDSDYWYQETYPAMLKLTKQANIMSKKYAVVCTNPPYMNKLEGQLKKFVVEKYKPYSGDLFSVFMYRNFDYCKPNGYSAFMTPFVWMFIKTYEQLREYIIEEKAITTLVEMEYSAFEEATVPICSFVLKNSKETEKGLYFKLSEFKGGMKVQKQKVLEALENKDCGYFYETSEVNFCRISGSPIAYWVSEKMYVAFERNPAIAEIAPPKQGLATANNELFLRFWFEPKIEKIGFGMRDCQEALNSGMKWFPYNKGGAFRRWYGNRDYVVNWEKDGFEIKNFRDEYGKVRSRPQNLGYFFRSAITWSDITSATFSGRYSESGFIFDIKGSSGFPVEDKLYYILGFLNSLVSQKCIKILNPTITTQVGDMARIPVIFEEKIKEKVELLVEQNVAMARTDWDSYENSWDFKKHPLLHGDNLKFAFENWKDECNIMCVD